MKPLSGIEWAQQEKKPDSALVSVDGKLWDMSRALPQDAQLELIDRSDPRALETLRHDCAHIMAQAVKRLWPDVQVTIGPAIENGFYYDFYKSEPFVAEDLAKIEAEMHKIVDENLPFFREVWTPKEATAFFEEQGEHFKVELIQGIEGEITLYRQGEFVDLCRGPHFPQTGTIGHHFKLTKLAGAYWRGDSTKPMLQRIYGTAWATAEELEAYLTRLEEAEKRDHRKLGPQLGLFHIQEEAPGCAFWHPKGWTLWRLLEQYIRSELDQDGYVEVKTPQLLEQTLWELSGHWDKFYENMFVIPGEPKSLVMKPMNCPCHVQIFKQGVKSYRDLPLRMAEFGCCHRNEPKGALHGIMRGRVLTQDDAHIFCTPDQIVSETQRFCTLLKKVYTKLGFSDIQIQFSTRPEKRAGSEEIWDAAEQALEHAAKESGLSYVVSPGEGAFYGPKLEFHLRDAIGRSWQCGTLQVDFILPDRLGAHYIDAKGEKQHPVMLHRAILGSFERFLGIMIEHYNGSFPFWLAPTQIVVASITSDVDGYATRVYEALLAQGYRCELDVRNEQISYKVREHSAQKIPYIVSVGKREQEQNTISVRTFGSRQSETHALEAWKPGV